MMSSVLVSIWSWMLPEHDDLGFTVSNLTTYAAVVRRANQNPSRSGFSGDDQQWLDGLRRQSTRNGRQRKIEMFVGR